VAQAVISGANRQTPTGRVFMPASGAAYSDSEIAAVANYIKRSSMNVDVRVTEDIRLKSLLAKQREAFLRDGAPPLAKRRANLLKLKNALLARRAEYQAAIDADFGHRIRTDLRHLRHIVRGDLLQARKAGARHVVVDVQPVVAVRLANRGVAEGGGAQQHAKDDRNCDEKRWKATVYFV
jgi:hypothetical protein